MSRAALQKQAGRSQEREARANEIFQTAIELGRSRSKNALPLWGPDDSFHFNPLLLRNTIHSPYFQKCCETLLDWNAVIDEIYYEVKHLLPFGVDKTPSTAFSLLLRLLTLRMTAHQMDLTLNHADSPYIRGIGFLYLRYGGIPEQMWQWIEKYVNDPEELTVDVGHRAKTITMGEFVRNLFSQREYYGTTLPRLPIQVERDLQVQLLQAEKVAERALQHFKNQQRMKHFQTLGSRIMALYGDDENPVGWYEAVVDRVITRDDATGQTLVHPKFVVTFSEYGNTETVLLGEVDVLDGNWRNDRVRSGDRGNEHEYDEVRRRERENVAATKGWARRPPTTKSSLSSASGSGYNNVRDEYKPPPRRKVPVEGSRDVSSQAHPPRKRTAADLSAIEEKKRKLAARYG